MDDGIFKELLEAANEAVAHHRGEKTSLRTTVLPERPRPMSRRAVKKLRERARVSQPVFAHYLNVSPKLVQAWEGGTRVPDGPALVLLRIAEQSPGIIFMAGGAQLGSRGRKRAGRAAAHRDAATSSSK